MTGHTGAMTDAAGLYITWDELHRDARRLAQRLLPRGSWAGVVAIARGGLVPAAIIARELEVRLLETLCVASYDDRTQTDLKVLGHPEKAIAVGGVGWLIVDDLVDSGSTAKLARTMLPHAHVATIYAKPRGLPTVDTYVTEVAQDTWVYFPWDMELRPGKPLVHS